MKQQTAGAISLARALWVAGLLTVASGATTRAEMLSYIIYSNGGLFGVNLAPLSVTGTFTFDTVKLAISSFDVTFGGEPGTYTETSNPYLDLSNPDLPLIAFAGPNDQGELLHLGLRLNGLGYSSSYEIVGGYWAFPAEHPPRDLYPRDDQNRPTVVRVVSDPAVPEPSTWAMMLGAFASAAAWVRVRRRKGAL